VIAERRKVSCPVIGFVCRAVYNNNNNNNIDQKLRTIITEALAELPYTVLWKWESDRLPGKPSNGSFVHLPKGCRSKTGLRYPLSFSCLRESVMVRLITPLDPSVLFNDVLHA
jgi:hypothetical protein